MSEQIISKRCYSCKQTKPISEFGKNRAKPDGHRSCCKICHNRNSTKYQRTDKGKKTHKRAWCKYNQTPKRKVARKRYNDSTKGQLTTKCYRQTEKGKEVLRASQKRFYANHPNFIKATSAVNNAIKAGKLSRPDTLQCHYCPAQAQQYHHWHGYAPEHWLDVAPACNKCHAKVA